LLLQRGAKFFGFMHAKSVSEKILNSDEHFGRSFSFVAVKTTTKPKKKEKQ
jgi:hypothetical protein